ncbi:MAG: response regulator [Vulcanimicrobiota bacterium]
MEIRYELKINKKIYTNLSFGRISQWILQGKVDRTCSVYRSGLSGYRNIDRIPDFEEMLQKYESQLRSSINILIVEDDTLSRETLKEILSERDYNVVDTSSAYEALNRVKEYDFQLAFIDIKMPGMNGVQLLKLLRNLDISLKVIIMTGFTLPDLEREALDLGVEFILRKPFSIDTIYQSVDEFSRYMRDNNDRKGEKICIPRHY